VRDVLQTLLKISFYAGLIPSLVFVVLYGFRSAWRYSSTGRATMLLMSIIALSYSLGVVALIWPRFFLSDYALWIALVIRVLIALVLINLTLVLIRTQNEDRHDREDSAR
jgi:FlaA1/EpsC-like NDP-sugar epimerase